MVYHKTTKIDVDQTFEKSFGDLTKNNRTKDLGLYPPRTETSIFHLKTKLAHTQMKITWNGTTLKHTPNPKYSGVTLHRTLTIKDHYNNTQLKVSERNNRLRKPKSASWGANPTLRRTTASSRSLSTAEDACPVWFKSSHCQKVDKALNETCRKWMHKIEKIEQVIHSRVSVSPPIRREAWTWDEKWKQENEERKTLRFRAEHNGKKTEVQAKHQQSTRERRWLQAQEKETPERSKRGTCTPSRRDFDQAENFRGRA